MNKEYFVDKSISQNNQLPTLQDNSSLLLQNCASTSLHAGLLSSA